MRLVLRPLNATDRAPLVRILEQLSFESRLNRFLVPIQHYSESMLGQLTAVDERNHFAWLALLEEGRATTPVADARYVRVAPGSTVAEIGIAVADRVQHRRIGTVLLGA